MMGRSNLPVQAWLTVILLVSVFAVMAWDKLRAWLVFLGAVTVS